MPAEIGNPLHLLVALGDLHFLSVPLHGQKCHHLVVGPFHVELDLGVLIGGAQGLHGRLPGKDLPTVQGSAFAKALGPELPIPVCDAVKRVGIGHHDGDVFAPLGVENVVDGRVEVGRILPDFHLAASALHKRGARQQLSDVHASESR